MVSIIKVRFQGLWNSEYPLVVNRLIDIVERYNPHSIHLGVSFDRLRATKMRTILFISIFLGYLGVAYSQNIGIAEKEAINGMVLYKAYTDNKPEGGMLTPVKPEYFEGFSACYFDEEGNLRKFVQRIEYPESLLETIAYYSEEGELMYIRFCNNDTEGYSYQGMAYKISRDYDWGDTIEYRYKVQNRMMADFDNYSIQGKSNKYPAITCQWNELAKYTHVDSLASFFRVKILQPPDNCKKVQFSKPSKNQITYINNDNVNLREGAKTSTKVIRTMGSGEIVKILEVLQEETVKNVGTFNWYKIEVNQTTGYIFGAYLEPVEKEAIFNR